MISDVRTPPSRRASGKATAAASAYQAIMPQSMRSVFSNLPTAWAKRRTERGLTMATGMASA
jgi:hypothetical protein